MPSTDPVPPWRPDRPHDALPPLPPPVEVETRDVLKACIEARAALAELKQAAELIPNPTLLVRALPLLEAQASSEIENIVTTADKLFEHLGAEGSADPATKEALRYRSALLGGFDSLGSRPLCTATAEEVCSTIHGREMRIRKVPGTALANQHTGEVIYTPPVGESRIRDLLADWERYLHAEDRTDPLVKLAVAHYQFEAIHPFTDGNGRTGRILNILFLVERGLLPLPILYLSRHILRNRPQYYEGLLAVTREEAWEPWILYLLEGITETSRWTTRKIDAIRELTRRTVEHVREVLPKVYSRELVELLFEEPYCRIANVTAAGLAKRQTASTHLAKLVNAGVLELRTSGREKIFINTRLVALLTSESEEIAPFPGAGS